MTPHATTAPMSTPHPLVTLLLLLGAILAPLAIAALAG
jgi:hypothetical protein